MILLGLNRGHLNGKPIVFVWNGAMSPWMLSIQITNAAITSPTAQSLSTVTDFTLDFPQAFWSITDQLKVCIFQTWRCFLIQMGCDMVLISGYCCLPLNGSTCQFDSNHFRCVWHFLVYVGMFAYICVCLPHVCLLPAGVRTPDPLKLSYRCL